MAWITSESPIVGFPSILAPQPNMLRSVRDRSATRALILGLLALPFGLLSPLAIWSGGRSLARIRRSHGELRGSTSALIGLAGGLLGALFLAGGVAFWLSTS